MADNMFVWGKMNEPRSQPSQGHREVQWVIIPKELDLLIHRYMESARQSQSDIILRSANGERVAALMPISAYELLRATAALAKDPDRLFALLVDRPETTISIDDMVSGLKTDKIENEAIRQIS